MENVTAAEILATSDAPKLRFLVGDLVEVRQQDKGLRGSWYSATVVEVLKGQRMVEYDELLEVDGKTKLREPIPVGRASDGDYLMGTLPLKARPKKTRPLLRPRPHAHPDSQPISWQEGVWVDCFYEDAWWEGILAENITTVNVEDVAQITRKSEVDVFFPEENDISKMRVSQMRIGQEWDEETGNWSMKGCAPVPVLLPKKKPSKKNSRQSQSNSEQQEIGGVSPSLFKEAATATNSTDSALCVNSLALERSIILFVKKVEAAGKSVASHSSKGYGYEERLHMFRLGGTSPNVPPSIYRQDLGDASPAIVDKPVLEEKGVDFNNAPDDAVPIEQMNVRSPAGSKASTSTQNDEAAEKFLKSTGWTIIKTPRKKTREVMLKCKSPRISGAAAKTFASLVEAFRFEGSRSPPGRNSCKEFPTLLPATFADRTAFAIGEDEDEKDEYAISARQILKRSGWDVFRGLQTGKKLTTPYYYITPEAGGGPRKWFKNWRLACEEYTRHKHSEPKQQASVPNHKKRGGRGEDVSPLPTPKKVTRRLSMPGALPGPLDTKGSAHGSGPAFLKSKKEVLNSTLPKGRLNGRDYSDVEDIGKAEVKIVVNSGRNRTSVDPGQNFPRSKSTPTSPSMNLYLGKPFGIVSAFTENDHFYVLHVITHDFSKEQISTTVENTDMVIKARYVGEESLSNPPVRLNGSMSARVTLPKNVEREKITAELKSPFLIFTLPKKISVPEDPFEIQIQ